MDVTTQIGHQEKDDKQFKIAAHTGSLDVTVTDAAKSKIEEPIEPKIDVAKIVEATVGPTMVGSDYLTEIMEDVFDLSENKRREHKVEGMEEIVAPGWLFQTPSRLALSRLFSFKKICKFVH